MNQIHPNDVDEAIHAHKNRVVLESYKNWKMLCLEDLISTKLLIKCF
jgi:hypothetical protein